MFKKGDVVVCTVDTGDLFNITKDWTYTVLEDPEPDSKMLNIRGDNGNEMLVLSSLFRLKYPEPRTLKATAQGIGRKSAGPYHPTKDYSFKLSSPDALNVQEVKEDLTKKDPLAIIHRDDGTHTFVVHNSIWHKVRYTNDSLSERFDDLLEKYDHGEKFIKTERGNISEIVDCIRDIINASYENKKDTTFKVNVISF